MLAYYVEWHMRKDLAPILFDDDDPETAKTLRKSVVSPAMRSPRSQQKTQKKITQDGMPVLSFQNLLKSLAAIVSNHLQPKDPSLPAFEKITQPNPLQQRALDLLRVPL